MRAAVFRSGGMMVAEVPEPVPAAGQVLVKTLCCGICGSDLHYAKHAVHMTELSKRVPGRAPLDLSRDVVFGHEFCGEVLDYGPGTERKLKAGTLVCSMPVIPQAEGHRTVGYSNDFPGGFGERMVLAESLLLAVPNGLSAEHAALTEPLAVGIHAVEKADLKEGDQPLVIGCGPVGLAAIVGLRLKGVHPIIAADFSPKRRELAAKMGADIVIDPKKESPYAKLAAGRRAVIFECVGVPGLLQQVFEAAPKDARVVVAGVCMEPDRIEPLFGILKELSVQFVLGYTPEEFARCLRLLAEGQVEADALITGKVGLDGVKGAFEELANPERHTKILVEPWR
ncbi:MAG: alcohol dehydrogenase [Reyranella sp.]|nr:MAG: alcohol dehydrogenase [Reyranella sp.]